MTEWLHGENGVNMIKQMNVSVNVNNRSHIFRRKSKMINIDSENALSMMKFDMEIAKT